MKKILKTLSPLNWGPPGKDWRAFGDRLGFTSSQLDQIKLEASCGVGDERNHYIAYILNRFLEKTNYKENEIMTHILAAIQKCKRDDLYQSLKEILNLAPSTANPEPSQRQVTPSLATFSVGAPVATYTNYPLQDRVTSYSAQPAVAAQPLQTHVSTTSNDPIQTLRQESKNNYLSRIITMGRDFEMFQTLNYGGKWKEIAAILKYTAQDIDTVL